MNMLSLTQTIELWVPSNFMEIRRLHSPSAQSTCAEVSQVYGHSSDVVEMTSEGREDPSKVGVDHTRPDNGRAGGV